MKILISSWFREVYKNDTLLAEEVDPLKDPRVTISGGQLIINNPNQVRIPASSRMPQSACKRAYEGLQTLYCAMA